LIIRASTFITDRSMTAPNTPDDVTRARPQSAGSAGNKNASTGSWNAGEPSRSSATPTHLGRFEIRKILGEGAFGCVYLAFDPKLIRDVAIKVPHRNALTPTFRERFLREARATAKIHHPNVCPVHEAGEEGDLPYIVMHFVVGGTLAGLLDKLKEPLAARHALVIARKLALGMAAAHAQGVIHRDLKPQNVLYDRANREVLITDFGLARVESLYGGSVDGDVMGTPAYMAPEQARGKQEEVGPLSDVYALGVILYRMLTGDVPFRGSMWEVMRDHCETPPQPPSSIRPALDPRLDAICLKAMAKKPADRYPSAKAFADTLSDAIRASKQTELPGATAPTEALDLPEPEPSEADPSSATQRTISAVEPAAATVRPSPSGTTPRSQLVPPPLPPSYSSQPPSRRSSKRWILALVGLFVMGGAAWWGWSRFNRPSSKDEQPVASKDDKNPETAKQFELAPEPRAAGEPKPKDPEGTFKNPETTFDPNKLLGRWERVLGSGVGGMQFWEFRMNGISITGSGSTATVYKLEGDKLIGDAKSPKVKSNKDGKIVYTIIKLTDDTLELDGPAGKKAITYRRSTGYKKSKK
jgi:serine/threonine protein kinase